MSPFPLPARVALARSDDDLRPGLVRAARYELKFGGFRAVWGGRRLWSRHGSDLTRLVPDLLPALRALPSGCVLDGELIAFEDGGVSFGAQQQRLVAGRRLDDAVAGRPAQLVVFDVLAAQGHDVRRLPLDDRREVLQLLLSDSPPGVTVAEQSRDLAVAKQWMRSWATAGIGIEGVVMKCGTASYPTRAGQRVWHKVKARRTLDLIAVAVLGTPDRPTGIVLADDHGCVVGDTTYLDAATAATVAALVTLTGDVGQRRPFWAGGGPVDVHGIDPLPVEVSADAAIDDGRLRHPARLVRLRADLEVRPTA